MVKQNDFVMSINEAASMAFMIGNLGDAAWLTDKKDPCKRLKDIYHRSCTTVVPVQ